MNTVGTIPSVEAHGAGIPLVGLGTWELRGRTCARVVEQALRLGYRHLDTAELYENEREVGEGLRASGVRRDDVQGRLLTTVFYRGHGSRVAYTIVPGAPLRAGHDVRTIRRGGLSISAFATTGHRLVVMWLRRGHTCVLSGVDVPLDALVKLAAWRGHGTLPY